MPYIFDKAALAAAFSASFFVGPAIQISCN
jgi:hypothetical protein